MRQMLNLPDDVINHLKTQDNMSAYITRLVRVDMSHGKQTDLEAKIRSIVADILKDKNISIGSGAAVPNIDESLAGSILSILG